MALEDQDEAPRQRACGVRQEGGLYLSVPTGEGGFELEHFLIDPAIPWEGSQLRSPMVVPDATGVNHIILGIGASSYSFFPDFFEEARIMGVSKRLPRGFTPERLKFGTSKFLLMHPKGIPTLPYATKPNCPKGPTTHEGMESFECVGALWPLSAVEHSSDMHKVTLTGDGHATINTPSVEYKVKLPLKKLKKGMRYQAGILLQFRLFNFEFVSTSRKVPDELKERFARTGYSLEAVPE